MNLKDCETFLAELGRGLPDTERVMVGYAAEATVQTDATGKKINKGWWPEPWKPGKYIKTSGNCYVCISSSIKTLNDRGAMRFWRGEASFGHGLALMVDDIGDGAGAKGGLTVDALSVILPPTAVVRTSPGNHQLWYFFDEPEENMRRFKSFLVCFVRAVLTDRGGDTTIRDVSRYGRMPVGINNKRLEDGTLKYPRGTEVVLASKPDYSLRYSMDQIAAAFKFDIVEPEAPREYDESKADEYAMDEYWLQYAVAIVSKAKGGEGSNGAARKNMSGKYRMRCPWGDEHSNGDPYGAYMRGYITGAEHAYVFGCAHDSCRKQGRTWSVFIEQIIMPFIIMELNTANQNHDQYDWCAIARSVQATDGEHG